MPEIIDLGATAAIDLTRILVMDFLETGGGKVTLNLLRTMRDQNGNPPPVDEMAKIIDDFCRDEDISALEKRLHLLDARWPLPLDEMMAWADSYKRTPNFEEGLNHA